MTLSNINTYKQIIGCLMMNPSLLLEYNDIHAEDFDLKCARYSFGIIQSLYQAGATQLSPQEVDMAMEKHPGTYAIYQKEHGLDFLKESYNSAILANIRMYYDELKKYSLLRRLQREKYDISEYYLDDKDIQNPTQEMEIRDRFEKASLEDILNSVESKYNVIRNDYLNGGHLKGDAAEGIEDLIEELRTSPSIGPSLEGTIFSTVCRGARKGCFYLKSSSSGSGKTRTSIFDACHIAFPIRWDYDKECFVEEVTAEGEFRQPRKTLFIVTEMDKEELQTIMLAYLSGVNEDHILTGNYDYKEYDRVRYAAKIMEKYREYFIIEEISEPNLVNVQATIKKYATLEHIKYCFFDYIHSTASMISQFSKNNLREDVILMLMANQLKQLAKDYGIFIFSATQVNMSAMDDDGSFKNEMSIRASKAIVDKADVGYVMTKIGPKTWDSIVPALRVACREGKIDTQYIDDELYRPTHILDIYKMRRGRYKNVRIWVNLDLGTGHRKDLFMTTADNFPISSYMDMFADATVKEIIDWSEQLDKVTK